MSRPTRRSPTNTHSLTRRGYLWFNAPMSKHPEQLQWQRASAVLHTYALCQRHEDRYSSGIPDVSFVQRDTGRSGWVELKTISAWSRGPTRIPHLSVEQVNWIGTRSLLGAAIWVLLWVREPNEWLWIPGRCINHDMRISGMPADEWRALDVGLPFHSVPE